MAATALMGLPFGLSRRVLAAARRPDRPPVVWLHFQECTGCTGSLLRSSYPSVAEVILEMISLEYHETLMAGAGVQAEEALHEALRRHRGGYLLVVEGAIPMAAGGVFCKVGGRTAIELLGEAAEGAGLIVCLGTCAVGGGIQAAAPNPTGAVGVSEVVKDRPMVHLPGCPPSPYNFLSTLLYYLTFGRLPELDAARRPRFAYGRRLHEHCERRPHFDAGRFAGRYGDAGHAEGWCLYKLGCKGPATFANCAVQRFNDIGVWPVSVGHPCIGCTEPELLFRKGIEDKVPIFEPTPFEGFAPVEARSGSQGVDPVTTGLVGLGLGAAAGAAAMYARQLPAAAPAPEKGAHEGAGPT